MPRASVIVPVFNNVDRLELELRTLEQQTCDLREIEFIVVDDGSTEDVAGVVARSPLAIRYVRRDHAGRAVTRNAGVRMARSDLLIFLDADLLLGPTFLETHLSAHEQAADLVIGQLLHFPPAVYPDACRRVAAGLPLAALQDLAREDAYLRLLEAVFADDRRRRLMPWICCIFSNTSVRREVLERAGGFDEGFIGWGLEDIELGYRLHRVGCRFQFTRAVTSYHLDHAKHEDTLVSDMVRNIKHFYQRHPVPEIALYRRFVAGFVSLEQLERAFQGADIRGEQPGHRETLFKPFKYSQMKS